jgi:hypothetical protein
LGARFLKELKFPLVAVPYKQTSQGAQERHKRPERHGNEYAYENNDDSLTPVFFVPYADWFQGYISIASTMTHPSDDAACSPAQLAYVVKVS